MRSHRLPILHTNGFKDVLGTPVLEALVEHQPLNDPTAEAERIEPTRGVAVQRLGVSNRVGGCGNVAGHVLTLAPAECLKHP